GNLMVPTPCPNAPGRLTAAEYARVRRHEAISVFLLARIDMLAGNTKALTYYGLDAPLEARIVHVADAFDAMTSTRAYRRAMSQDDALAELHRNTGRQFDADCVHALVRVLERRGERYRAGDEPVAGSVQVAVPP